MLWVCEACSDETELEHDQHHKCTPTVVEHLIRDPTWRSEDAGFQSANLRVIEVPQVGDEVCFATRGMRGFFTGKVWFRKWVYTGTWKIDRIDPPTCSDVEVYCEGFHSMSHKGGWVCVCLGCYRAPVSPLLRHDPPATYRPPSSLCEECMREDIRHGEGEAEAQALVLSPYCGELDARGDEPPGPWR